jgi:RimJ/RimL family protein N-acetyltransferase
MKETFVLLSDELPAVSLRTARLSDCENLRTWKNGHRGSFFFQEPITAEGQREWFAGYLSRPDDWMFVVLVGDEPVGCMGFRLRDGQADVYNVILGRPEHGGRGVMAEGQRLMCSYARSRLGAEIVARVLKENPAMGWYRKRGFDVISEQDTHYVIRLADERFAPVTVTRKEI